ncbi:nitrous oxide reductase accessory protein NosL [Salipiger mucosus]|uniref:Nitrous oxide reductase maturation protein, outer-membrane lipoprotein NosL n=1 Tax=Salipiger mucosus DSM 16094 TaxID=1123237 RepID=S9QDC6_9RHOB|nr:nitrous oxide reductase accessory protein NosL [Salipiger mucosus]EPX77932.1 Nitrous oxide reductase maturation protein, outer-membrane lipoprotein NosL [Salipiger mucosus DSM 16094]
MKPLVFVLLASVALAGCKEETAAILPVAMTDEALGHYCQMFVADHPGPKAQVHLKGQATPLWFSQVSDAVAYLHDPERDAEIMGIFVSDMARAETWALPGTTNWLAAEAASLVIESARPGGMGVPEAIPFGDRAAALAFVAQHGGRVVGWGEVPETYVRPDMSEMLGHAMNEEASN